MALKILRRTTSSNLADGTNLAEAIIEEGVRSLGVVETSRFEMSFPAAESAIRKIQTEHREKDLLRPQRSVVRPSIAPSQLNSSSLTEQIRREGEHFSR